MKRTLFIASILILVLSACGAQATPTIDPAQVQDTAVAAAGTMIAETQTAMPTPTMTDTPEPSATPSPSPTAIGTAPTDMSLVPSTPTSTGADPCKGPISANPGTAGAAGKVSGGSNIKIVNGTKAPITFSLYLAMNKAGQCGWASYQIAPAQSVLISNTLPYGCYSEYAMINDPKKPSQVSHGPDCITGPDKTTFTVTVNGIQVIGP